MATGLLVAALVAGGVGTYLSIQAQRQQTAAEKANLKYNAALAQQKADEERKIGKLRTEARRKKTQQILASQRAAYGKAGVQPAGTPISVRIETAKNEALNALLIGREAEVAARGYESQRGLYEMQAKAVGRAGRLAVGAELFGGIGQSIEIVGGYKRAKKEKP